MFATKPPPRSIIGPDGLPRFGVYDAPIVEVDIETARIRSHGILLGRALSRFRLKEWQHFGIIAPNVFLSFAVVDVKYLHTSWCQVVDRASWDRFEHSRQGPMLEARIARELFDAETWARARGYRIEIRSRLNRGFHELRLRIDGSRQGPAVRADLRCTHDLSTNRPLEVVLPVGRGRCMYSHKVPLPVEGVVTVGARTYELSADESFAVLDVHKAHYPRRTFWNWATFAGRDSGGRAIAANLTRNVNADDELLNENATWVDGRITHLGAARFELDRTRLMAPWRISTTDGLVDLTFTPRGERSEDLRLGVVRSTFHQPYGTFTGVVSDGTASHSVDDLFGMCEDHEAVW